MSGKFYFLIFASLLLVQCALSDSSEEDSGEKILARNIVTYYLEMVDNLFVTLKKAFEPIFKDLENDKFTTKKNFEDKLTQLKTAMEKTNEPVTTNCNKEKRRIMNDMLLEIGKLFDDLEKMDNKENESILEPAFNTIKDEVPKGTETFANKCLKAIEEYWKDLTPKEQEEEKELGKVINDLKNATTGEDKIVILDKIFDFRADTGAFFSKADEKEE